MTKVGAVSGKYTPKTIVTSPTRTLKGQEVVKAAYGTQSKEYQTAFI